MQAKFHVAFANTVADDHVVGLLETNSVAVVIPDRALRDFGPKAAIQKNPSPTTSVQMGIRLFVAFNDQVLHTNTAKLVAANHRKDRGCLRLVADHTVGHQWLVDRECIACSTGNPGHSRVKSARSVIPNGDAMTDVESGRIFDSDLLLTEIAIKR